MTYITKENLIRHELIGLRCRIVNATNPSLIGIKGIVIDETKNMLIIKNKKEWMIPKSEVVLEFRLKDGKVKINGRTLVGRPEDRVKMHGNRNRCKTT
jgi:ribonuclease P protein subunit POP4